MTRHYYAAHIPYGTNSVPGPYNYPSVYVFNSKAQRDQVVADLWKYFTPISAKTAHKIDSDHWYFVAPDGNFVAPDGTVTH